MRTDIPSRCWLQMAFDRRQMGRWVAEYEREERRLARMKK